jgi:hypothetical protein
MLDADMAAGGDQMMVGWNGVTGPATTVKPIMPGAAVTVVVAVGRMVAALSGRGPLGLVLLPVGQLRKARGGEVEEPAIVRLVRLGC